MIRWVDNFNLLETYFIHLNTEQPLHAKALNMKPSDRILNSEDHILSQQLDRPSSDDHKRKFEVIRNLSNPFRYLN